MGGGDFWKISVTSGTGHAARETSVLHVPA